MDTQKKIISAEEFNKYFSEGSTRPTTVFTNGCFDLLHPGHVDYLEKAASFGDILVVGLNSDRSVKKIKGEGRPVNREQDRARVLAALACLDFVILFEESTPLELITRLAPDVLVKGGDWPVEKIIGGEIVENAGGEVVSLQLLSGYSTTNILARIKNA